MSAPAVPCFGACGGVPGKLIPPLNVVCSLCQGSGLYKPAPSWREEYRAVVALRDRARQGEGFSAEAYEVRAVKGPRRAPRFRRRVPPGQKKRNREIARRAAADAAREKTRCEAAAFAASRPADWNAQLDQLKREWNEKCQPNRCKR